TRGQRKLRGHRVVGLREPGSIADQAALRLCGERHFLERVTRQDEPRIRCTPTLPLKEIEPVSDLDVSELDEMRRLVAVVRLVGRPDGVSKTVIRSRIV